MYSYNIILEQVTIYGGLSLFVIGVVGNLINIHFFHNNNLQNPSNFILFFVSCVNFIYLHVGLLPRILSQGFHKDITAQDISLCKIRSTLVQICALSSLACSCYAIIDQFFASSNREKWRRLSRISLTRKMTVLIVFVSVVYSIPITIFSSLVKDSSGEISCTVLKTNLDFNRFSSYFSLPIFWTIGPISVMMVFGFLTYRNVSRLRGNLNRVRAQRRLTSMVFLHVICIIIGTIPFASFYIYSVTTLSTIKSTNRQALESFLENIVSAISYVSFSGSVFVYCLCSKTYRDQLIKYLTGAIRRLQRRSSVHPQIALH